MMDEKDRRASLQLGRQARKSAASPYARPASPATRVSSSTPTSAATPSRLSGLLSYLSPFRRGKQREPSPEPQEDEDDDEQQDDDDEVHQKADDEDDEEEVDDAPQFALHGKDLAHAEESPLEDADMEANAPPSPTPYQSIYPNLGSSLTASKSMPALAFASASTSTTPRIPGGFSAFPRSTTRTDFGQFATPVSNHSRAPSVAGSERSPPGRANEELARFFREKADRGDETLTAVEQAGVLHLMQQAQVESLPTAFTPSFRSASPAPAGSAHPFQTDQPEQSIPASPSMNSIFGGSPSANAGSEASPGRTPYRRRRPIYVGAGYSSRSARRTTPSSSRSGEHSGLSRSQSEGSFMQTVESVSPVVEGKRRRIENDDAPPVVSSTSLSPLAEPSPPPSASKSRSAGPSIFSVSKLAATSVSTPVRPSPLWQVSKAETPSPSPPKKVASPAVSRPASRAADMMMDIIRQEDEARPKDDARDAVLNPYESTENNPLARVPRSRPPRPATPKRPASARLAANASASPAPAPAKEVSQLEQLERTMPAEYRKDDAKRAKVASSIAASSTTSAPKKQKGPSEPAFNLSKTASAKPAVKSANPFAALSSGGEDDAEGEEYEEEDDEEDDGEDDDITVEEIVQPQSSSRSSKSESKQSKPLQSGFSSTGPASSSTFSSISAFGSTKPVEVDANKTAPTNTFSAFGSPATKAAESSVVSSKSEPPAFAPPKPAFSFSIPAATAAAEPAPAFITTPSPAVTQPSSTPASPANDPKKPLSDAQAQAEALSASKSSLPAFNFEGIWSSCPGRGEAQDAVQKAAQEVVRGMSKSELTSFAF